MQRSLDVSVYDSTAVEKVGCGACPPPKFITNSCPWVKSNPLQTLGTHSQKVSNDSLSTEDARPKDSAYLDFYVPDGKGNRLSQLSQKCSGLLSQTGNLLLIIKLLNLMEK